ncbi:hypothetical protein DSO57_1031513 [Entomophthora muscae]|uniref:Uncharacterized protein n=1 Tax=Entomophthora muscae TaxID=34485 RepID=A0ACC2UL93_9FUNG|nr:hypothetical protein DSO57_1031513 [Entomophthora muscae]
MTHQRQNQNMVNGGIHNMGKQVCHHLAIKEGLMFEYPKIKILKSLRAALPYCVANVEERGIIQMDVCVAGGVDRGMVPASLDGLKSSGATLHLVAQEAW